MFWKHKFSSLKHERKADFEILNVIGKSMNVTLVTLGTS